MSTELGVRLRHLHQFSTVLLEEPQPLMNTSSVYLNISKTPNLKLSLNCEAKIF